MRKSGCLAVFLFFALCLSLFANLILFSLLVGNELASGKVKRGGTKGVVFEETVLVEGGNKKVVEILLTGLIAYEETGATGSSMVEEIKMALNQAAEDSEVVAVVVSVDSPGGEVTAADVLHNAMKDFAGKKPLVVFMNSVGASGAYYAACAARWVMCNPTTFTGSIGVIITTLNFEGLMGKAGLEAVVFKSGKFKDMLSGTRSVTPEEAEYVQGLVMQSYERFLGVVAEGRKLDANKLRKGVADGRILSGEDALAAGLVDQVGYIEEAYNKAMELAGVKAATVVRYEPSFSWTNLLRLLSESRQSQVDLKSLLTPGALRLQPGRVYLLPAILAP